MKKNNIFCRFNRDSQHRWVCSNADADTTRSIGCREAPGRRFCRPGLTIYANFARYRDANGKLAPACEGRRPGRFMGRLDPPTDGSWPNIFLECLT